MMQKIIAFRLYQLLLKKHTDMLKTSTNGTSGTDKKNQTAGNGTAKTDSKNKTGKSGKTLNDLFEEELKDIYSAEKQLTEALPEMAKAAYNEDLQDAFTTHLQQTKR